MLGKVKVKSEFKCRLTGGRRGRSYELNRRIVRMEIGRGGGVKFTW
jgi:hypothetical protein